LRFYFFGKVVLGVFWSVKNRRFYARQHDRYPKSARGLAHSRTLRAIRESQPFAIASWSAAALRRFNPKTEVNRKERKAKDCDWENGERLNFTGFFHFSLSLRSVRLFSFGVRV
jgi:hypothetical protein